MIGFGVGILMKGYGDGWETKTVRGREDNCLISFNMLLCDSTCNKTVNWDYGQIKEVRE
jgi:hypothetical protein